MFFVTVILLASFLSFAIPTSRFKASPAKRPLHMIRSLAGVLGAAVLVSLFAPIPSANAAPNYTDDKCYQNGGDRDCIPIVVGDWQYAIGGGYGTASEQEAANAQPDCPNCTVIWSWVNAWGSASCQGNGNAFSYGISRLEVRTFQKDNYSNGALAASCPNCCAQRVRPLTCPANYTAIDATSGEGFCMGPARKFVNQTQKLPNMCSTNNSNQNGDGCGNPITPSTGNKTEIAVDYVGEGPFPLVFKRIYNSLPSLGSTWRHNYQRRIESRFDNYWRAMVYRQTGAVETFNNTSGWKPDSDINSRLEGDTVNNWTYYSVEDDQIETYYPDGKLQSVKNRAGLLQTMAYDGNGRLWTITDFAGRTLTLTYDGNGRLQTMTDPGSNIYSYGYDSNGNLTTVTYPGNKIRTYRYENTNFPNALTGITDENLNNYATFTYDTQGLAYKTEHAGGVEAFTISYTTPPQDVKTQWIDSQGVINATNSRTAPIGTTITDAFGIVRNVNYESKVGVVQRKGITGPACSYCGPSSTSSSDANGNVSSRFDFNGNQTTFGYDTNRNLETSRIEAVGSAQQRTISTQWHSQYRLPIQIDEPGRQTVLNYDASGNLQTKTVTDTAAVPPQSRVWNYAYYSDGQIYTEDGPRTDVTDTTTYTYYPLSDSNLGKRGQVATITNASGHVTQFTDYDPHGRPLTIIDPNNLMTTLSYDPRGRLKTKRVGTSATVGELTSYDYDDVGQLKQVTFPNGAYLAYKYDPAHRLTEVKDQLNNKIVYTPDLMSNVTKVETFNASGTLVKRHTREYDTLNRLFKDIGGTNPSNQVTQYGYDNNGNLTTIAAPLSRNTTNFYDARNRLFKVQDPLNNYTQYGYSDLDYLIGVEDPKPTATIYIRNSFGEATSTQSQDSGTTQRLYDPAGNLISKTDAKSQTTSYEYDALNRLKKEMRPDQTINYTYDAISPTGTLQKGRLTGMTDNSGSTTWQYDRWGRVVKKTSTIGTTTRITQYSYDATGQLSYMIYPWGMAIYYTWTNGKITAIKNGTTPIVSNIQYFPFGAPTSWTFNNGETVNRAFDFDGRMFSNSIGSIFYDSGDRIYGAYNRSYSYDVLDRLKTYGDGVNLYTYNLDANGNRTSQIVGSTTNSYNINVNNNRIDSISSGSVTKVYTHDNNGNVTTDGTLNFTFDSNNRLTEAKSGTTIIGTYLYNAMGQRVKKTATVNTTFAYDNDGQTLGEYTSSPVQETVYLGDIPIAVMKGSSTFYIHTDHLNTPRKITDSNKAIRWKWENASFGANAVDENPQSLGVFQYNLRHPGQYADTETGLFYNYFRDYDPKTGRYIESDPIGLSGGLNTFSYVDGNPISYIDPLGLARIITPEFKSFSEGMAWRRKYKALYDMNNIVREQVKLKCPTLLERFDNWGIYPDPNMDNAATRNRLTAAKTKDNLTVFNFDFFNQTSSDPGQYNIFVHEFRHTSPVNQALRTIEDMAQAAIGNNKLSRYEQDANQWTNNFIGGKCTCD